MRIFDAPNTFCVRDPSSQITLMISSKSGISRSSVAILFFIISLATFHLNGQGLTVNVNQLNFGTANELTGISRSVEITNTLSRAVDVSEVRFYTTYGAPAFSTTTSDFTIAAGATFTLDVWFAPRHNILHNSEMVILNDGLRGSVSVDLVGQGSYSKSYYAASQNKTEEDLKTSLGSITGNGYISLIYGPARDEMFMVIDNQRVNGQGASQNTIESIYTGVQAVGYTDRTDAQTNFLFNTEHTFPQSLFTSLEPMKSDLHHLFPTDDASNSMRADKPFGIVSSPSWSVGGSKSNGSIFEPRDEQKARSARAMFYFVLRYQNYSSFLNSQEGILRTWHSTFPPDAIDIKRNNDIYSFQNNRNPFIDYPQFIERINSLSSVSAEPLNASIDIVEDTMIYGNVPSSVNTDFRFVLVNRGNTTVSLSQFSLSHPGKLSFASFGNDTTLNPGESLGLDVRYFSSTTDSVRGWLSFQTNVSGQNFVSAPIFVNDLVFTKVFENERNNFSVFPNPVSDVVKIRFSNEISVPHIIQLYAMNGSLLQESIVSEGSFEKKLNTTDLAPGIYFVSIRSAVTGLATNLRFIKL